MRKGIRGWLALLLAALLMLPMAALADTTIETPEAIEPPVAEYTSLELSGADDAGEETCETCSMWATSASSPRPDRSMAKPGATST